MGAKEVAAGAAWLDENFPGWEREIDLGTLDINHCHACICGQGLRKVARIAGAYSGYDYAKSLHGLNPIRWAADHGFTLPDGDEGDWIELEQTWRELIKERFSSGLLSDEKEVIE